MTGQLKKSFEDKGVHSRGVSLVNVTPFYFAVLYNLGRNHER